MLSQADLTEAFTKEGNFNGYLAGTNHFAILGTTFGCGDADLSLWKNKDKVMGQLTIKLAEHSGVSPCPLCGEHKAAMAGPRLFLHERAEPVCRDCGQRHAPHLAALIELAQIAERVGRSSRYIMTPPMEALLALARAAEDYTFSTFKSGQQAA